LAIVALYDGEFDRIGALIEESITVFRAVGNTPGIAFCLDVAAGVAGAQGDAIRAARLWGASEALREELHSPRTAQQHRLFTPYVESARAALGDATCTRALAEGGAMTLEQAVEYALSGAESAS
jgi:hypothetical protein